MDGKRITVRLERSPDNPFEYRGVFKADQPGPMYVEMLTPGQEAFVNAIQRIIQKAKDELRAQLTAYMGPGAWALDAYDYLIGFSGEGE